MPLHLWQRKGIWHYSRTIPEDVRGVIGEGRYWRFTLGTGKLRKAEGLRAEWDVKYDADIKSVRQLTAPQKVTAIRSKHVPKPPRGLALGTSGKIEVHKAALRKSDIHKRRGVNADARASLSISERDAFLRAERLVSTLSQKERATLDKAGGIEALYREVTNAHDRRDALGDYRAADEAESVAITREVTARVLGAKEGILTKLGFGPATTEVPEAPDNPRILAALDAWLKKKPRAQSTVVKYRLHIGRLADFTSNTTIKSLTVETIECFVAAYGELPNARPLSLDQRKFGMRELLALRKLNPNLPPMGAENVIKCCDYLKAFLKGIKRHDLRQSVEKPVDDRSLAEQRDGYPPFSPEQMRRILPAVDKEFGSESDTALWVWLMAYSGARPEEAAQLDRANVTKVGNVWTMRIDDRDERRIKNSISHRVVPIHPVLVKRGFADFARPNDSDKGLVFQNFDYDDKGGRSNNPSRRFKRVLKELCIEGRGAAHRFRATFIDAARNAELSYAVEIGLVGHGDSRSRHHGNYGQGASLATLARNIGRVDPLADPSVDYGP
jgi:hypothetical protein